MIKYQWMGQSTDLDELWGIYEKSLDEKMGKVSFVRWFFEKRQEGIASIEEEKLLSKEAFCSKRINKIKSKIKERKLLKYQRSLPKKMKNREKAAMQEAYGKSAEFLALLEEEIAADTGYQAYQDPAHAEELYQEFIKEQKDSRQKQVRKELSAYQERIEATRRLEKIEKLNIPTLFNNHQDDLAALLQKELENAIRTRKEIVVAMLEDSYSGYGSWGDTYRYQENLTSSNLEYFLGDFADDTERAIADMICDEEYLDGYIENYLISRETILNRELFDEKEQELIRDEVLECCMDELDLIFGKMRLSPVYLLSLLMENPHYGQIARNYANRHVKRFNKKLADDNAAYEEKQKEAERARLLRENIVNSMPSRYIDLYPLARSIKRHFVLHIGPTNSGKTYSAMQALRRLEKEHSVKSGNPGKNADKSADGYVSSGEGIYLAPLRLLAYEQFEALNHDGYLCHLVTGEEKIMIPFANLQASTVEMADLKKPYEIAVIDEAQMISDRDRGGAWSAAILGLYCKEIHVCAAPEAEGLLLKLIESCQDSYEIIYHARQTPLVVEKKLFIFPDDVRAHDALIVFSRRNVHAVASELQANGIKCSIIYGNLPYDVRQEEARKFMDGDTQILVATDAIGMGMNLPIERIVFLETIKFDGMRKRPLASGEVKQIAGRAGRRGIYETGYVACCDYPKMIRQAMEEKTEEVKKARIHFPESLLGIEGKLSEIIERWISLPDQDLFEKSDAKEMLKLCRELERYSQDRRLIYEFLTIPTDYSNAEIKAIWLALFAAELKHQGGLFKEYLPEVDNRTSAAYLQQLELDYKICDLLHSYMEHCHPEIEHEEIMTVKKEISRQIMNILGKQKLTSKTCKVCGRPLPWNYMYGSCENCFRRR